MFHSRKHLKKKFTEVSKIDQSFSCFLGWFFFTSRKADLLSHPLEFNFSLSRCRWRSFRLCSLQLHAKKSRQPWRHLGTGEAQRKTYRQVFSPPWVQSGFSSLVALRGGGFQYADGIPIYWRLMFQCPESSRQKLKLWHVEPQPPAHLSARELCWARQKSARTLRIAINGWRVLQWKTWGGENSHI